MLVVVVLWRRYIQPHAVQVEHIWMDGVRYQIWGWSDPGYGQIWGMVESLDIRYCSVVLDGGEYNDMLTVIALWHRYIQSHAIHASS